MSYIKNLPDLEPGQSPQVPGARAFRQGSTIFSSAVSGYRKIAIFPNQVFLADITPPVAWFRCLC